MNNIKFISAPYDNEPYMPDSTVEEIRAQKPIKVEGLYFDYRGEKRTPTTIYFGIHFDRGFQLYGGAAWCHYDNALCPVYLPDGKQYRVPNLRCVNAYYDGVTIDGFYRN